MALDGGTGGHVPANGPGHQMANKGVGKTTCQARGPNQDGVF